MTAETAAFHGRKIVEGIAFSALVIVDHSIKTIPRDAKGQWNADKILTSLKSKGLDVLPSPSVIRRPTEFEIRENNPRFVIDGVPEARINTQELIEIYRRFHPWLHEINPYIELDKNNYVNKHASSLWTDLLRLNPFLERHFISINGQGFLCILRDKDDGQTKLIPLRKVTDDF